jgi:hypothetical protein
MNLQSDAIQRNPMKARINAAHAREMRRNTMQRYVTQCNAAQRIKSGHNAKQRNPIK